MLPNVVLARLLVLTNLPLALIGGVVMVFPSGGTLSVAPLALGVGEPGKEIRRPLAVVILGGIVTSTFLNMIVIPALSLKYGRAES